MIYYSLVHPQGVMNKVEKCTQDMEEVEKGQWLAPTNLGVKVLENVENWQEILGRLQMLHIDLRPGQTCHSKVMHRKEVTHSNGQ